MNFDDLKDQLEEMFSRLKSEIQESPVTLPKKPTNGAASKTPVKTDDQSNGDQTAQPGDTPEAGQ